MFYDFGVINCWQVMKGAGGVLLLGHVNTRAGRWRMPGNIDIFSADA